MPLLMTWTASTSLPVESDALRPDVIAGRSAEEVAGLPARVGKETVPLGDLFRIEGEGGDGHLILEGDLAHVRRIGAGMASGRLTIRGDVGPHLGAEMLGGTIELTGAASSWAGAEMRGGLIRIRGAAGDALGAAYPGSRRGMRDGEILVEGPVGRDAGLAMRRGLIAVSGPASDGLGRGMIAGSILAFGRVGRLVGAGMKRGTIALFDPGPSFEPSPTFAASGSFAMPVLTILLRHLLDRGFPVPAGLEGASVSRYNGDLLDRGQGEILCLEAD
ncbi:formylmethanofuran dehydrogenase subunit C [Tautonia sociabilis]|uniref:Formylmethanofuran dehydrogenase subunit C n=1 Tax=Tautonia sociabilis TaxID=2080755 RepID=A0A432MEY0_9BACT|nr:formylmethanofuran dehydrogenase subunit C [Tautonia sociabilis]RUL84315.1 formylmethanofuran dehydrogenase subunit C [Tautonia sociabilis]